MDHNEAIKKLHNFTFVGSGTTSLPDPQSMLSTIEQVERNFGPKLTASLADAADVVRAHGFGRERAWKAYRWGPTVPIPFLGDLELDTGEPSKMDEVVAHHKERLQAGVEEHWSMLLALEQVVSEVQAKFDGEDPALPVIRHVLDHSRERLEEMHGEVKDYTGPSDLPKPDGAQVASVRELAERQPPWP